MDAAQQRRNVTGRADRKIEDRTMRWLFIFLSLIFLLSHLPPEFSGRLRAFCTVTDKYGCSVPVLESGAGGRKLDGSG
jgi:hypothetical protein